jgi:cell division septum initiation protein DivIVA
MAQPVWTLSVDLQTRTATFQTGMADAAKAARGSFNDIKQGADEMGRATGGSMMEARHGVMLLGEEFGVHLPRALTSFIASIGPVGAAMEAAFPFLAIIVGATLLLQHLSKLKEEGQQLTNSQLNFGTTVTNVLNGLNDKLLQAGIRADELRGDHLAALNKELQRIDHQSMDELVQAFNAVAKAADVTFADLKTQFYQFGAGSAGAKNALEEFKAKYESLLAQGKSKEATDLLSGTKASAERVLELQKQIRDNQTKTGTGGTHQGDYAKFEQVS